MGIFAKKPAADKKVPAAKKEVKEKKEVVVAAPKGEKGTASFMSGRVIMAPRITEKAAHISDDRVYTFDVFPKATKTDIAKAIKEIYGVTPVRVNVSAIPTKQVLRRNRIGVKGGGRKAYVFLKKGDKIEFI